MAKKLLQDQLRLRVFAGPNGSGKSTIIKSVRDTKVNGRKIDFGIYINADDIARLLQLKKFSFRAYEITTTKKGIVNFAETSGLLTGVFDKEAFSNSFTISADRIVLRNQQYYEQVAQIVARYLRERILQEKKRFSFETVFSHESNIDIMKRTAAAGYKVYLYFVSTESAEINKFRVQYRVTQKGHDVPADKIASRYLRSLDLLYEAAETAYQCFFFDNSEDNKPFRLVNHFKRNGENKKWDTKNKRDFPNWFKKYYWERRS